MPNKKDTLCWDCQKAVKGCAWSQRFEPVEGWTAEKVERRLPYLHKGVRRVEVGETYHVIDCPEFVPDEPREKPKADRGRVYTEKEKAFIREKLAEGRSVSWIGLKLGRKESAMRDKVKKMRRAGEL